MRFGFHISIAGRFSRVFDRAKARGCEAIQFFSRNPRGWKYSPLNKKEVEEFRSSIQSSVLFPVFLHMPYLSNIASLKSKFYRRSIHSIATDLQRAEQLGAQYLIIHIGHRMESTEDEAIEAVSEGINQAFEKVKNDVILLMENTAGQGTEIGYQFDQIKKFWRGSRTIKEWESVSIRPTLLRQPMISQIRTGWRELLNSSIKQPA